MEQTRIPLLCRRSPLHRICDVVVIGIEHGQAVLRLEGIHQILCRLVEVPSARPHAPAAVQHIRPVGTSESGVVLLVVRVLYGEDALLRVLVLRQEDVAEVLQIAVF